MGEAREVTDLSDQPERGQRLDPAERTQGLDLAGPAWSLSDLLQAGVENRQLGVDGVEVQERLLERELGERIIEALGV